jgi:hypothetical protein
MARIQRRRHGGAEIHITQAHHQVTGLEYDAPDRLDALQSVAKNIKMRFDVSYLQMAAQNQL